MVVETSFEGHIDEFEPVGETLNAEIYPDPDAREQVGHLSYRHRYIPSTVKYAPAQVGVTLEFSTDPPTIDAEITSDRTVAAFAVDPLEGGIGRTLRLRTTDGTQVGLIDMPSDGLDIEFGSDSYTATITVESRPPRDSWSDEQLEKWRDRTRKQFEAADIEYL